MSFWRKLLEVLIQIALLPVAALTTALMLSPLTIILFFCFELGYLLEMFVLDRLKEYTAEEGRTYYVNPSDTVSISETGTGEYKLDVHHDDGKRYEISASEFGIYVIAFFALPLRIITLALSILALIIPPLQIKAKNNRGTFWSIVFDIA